MDKLKMHTPDLAEENYKKLAALFPDAVTETIDENGNVVRAIDKDVLMQEINAQVVDDGQERYQFTWPDKRKSVVLANAPIVKTLRFEKEKSVGRDGTPGGTDSENIYIEGDNLDALKLLQETYLGKVKMIYIDPPYNTGSDFVYVDDFSVSKEEWPDVSGEYDESKNRLVQNSETNGRFHTDWLNMMYPRLKIAKDFLSYDGVIFISIDDHELYDLKMICDEIFGAGCFVSDVSWQRTYSMRNDSKGIPTEVEHILIYSRSPMWEPKRLPRTAEMDQNYKNPDNDPEGAWQNTSAFAPAAATHQGMVYAIQHPFTGEMIYPTMNACWRYSQDAMLNYMNGWTKYKLEKLDDDEKRAEICGISADKVKKDVQAIVLEKSLEDARNDAISVYKRGNWPRFFFTNEGMGGIRRKTYLSGLEGKKATNFWPFKETGHTDEAKKELSVLFGGRAPFDTPKPVRLMKRILEISTEKDSIIMDFFSGSATMGHSIIEANAADNGSRKFVLIQLQEKSVNPSFSTLCDIGEERIRRAGKKIKEETGADIDYGFRCFKVDSSNMKDVYYRPADIGQMNLDQYTDNIKEDRTPEDLLIQVMLDLGVLLSSKVERTEIAGKKVFSVADGYLIACFDKDVTEDVVTSIAKQKPFYAVFRDSSFGSDSVAANFEQIFVTYSPQTVRKVL